MLAEYVSAVSNFIERKCNRRFLQTSYVNEVYDGGNLDGSYKDVLILKNAPMSAAPSSFQYRTGAKSSPVWVDFQIDTYQEVLEAAYIRAGLPTGFQNIRVSYIGGFLIDFAHEFDNTKHTLPYEISDLADRLCTRLFKKREAEGKDTESFNQSSLKWGDFLDEHDNEVIANHSRTVFV